MRNKDVINLLEKEGNKIVPSSLNVIKNKIQLTDKYIIETKLKAEAEQYVPNDMSYIKSNLAVKENKKHRLSFQVKAGLVSFAALATSLVIALPIANYNSNVSYQKGLSNLKMVVADEDSESETTLRCDVDANANIVDSENSITTLDQNSKKLIAGIKAKADLSQIEDIESFTIEAFNFGLNNMDANNQYLFKQGETYTINIDVFGGSATNNDFISRLKNQLNHVKNNLDDVTIEYTIKVDEDVTGNQDEDILNSHKSILIDLINKLFLEDDGKYVDGYVSSLNIDSLTLEQIDSIIDKLTDLYEHIPEDNMLVYFRNDLKEIYHIYSARKSDLTDLKNNCEQAIEYYKNLGYEDVDVPETTTQTNYCWWDENEYCPIDKNYYDHGYPKDDRDIIINIPFNRHDEQQENKEFEHEYEYSNNPIAYLKETLNQINTMIEENEQWFANAFTLLPDLKEIVDNNGAQYGSTEYQFIWSNFNYWDANKSYWNNYWR